VSGNLKIKASGGISNLTDAKAMIKAGADRIGTSKAQLIYNEK
jgi:deoxyribose-phosphate aldolase